MIDLPDEAYQRWGRGIRRLNTQDLGTIDCPDEAYQRLQRRIRRVILGTHIDIELEFEFDMDFGERYGATSHALLQTRTETAYLQYASSDVSTVVGEDEEEEEARRLISGTLGGSDGDGDRGSGDRPSFGGWVMGLARRVREAYVS